MRLAALILLSTTMHAAVIRGLVVENLTGKPLSRTAVTLRSVGGKGTSLSTYTNVSGIFELSPLPAGAYLVTASRKNFARVQYGQKDFRSAGLPVIMEETSSTFLNIRLPRLGVVTGRVVDENDVGLPNHEVVIYQNSRPPQLVQKIKADERGAYRFYGLDPGSYLVRTIAREYEEGSYVPTFAKEVIRVEEARPVEVTLDSEVDGIDVRPAMGKLYKLAGLIHPGVKEPVRLTLTSDMGREDVQASEDGPFRFNPVPPGDYEIYGEAPGDGSPGCAIIGVFLQQNVKDRDLLDMAVPVPCVRETPTYIYDQGGGRVNMNMQQQVQLLARRKDGAGTGEIRTLRVSMASSRVLLPPGRWEVMLKPPAGYCVAGFSFSSGLPDRSAKSRADGWNEILVGARYGSITFALSSHPSTIQGLVSGLSREAVAAAPVYLEGYDPEGRRRVTDLFTGIADMQGHYTITGLAPGTYRVLSTFEFQAPDADTMERVGAKVVRIGDGVTVQDLDLSVLR
jgi:hypothetical protein